MGFKLALWQAAGVPDDLPATVDAAADAVSRAADAGATLLVFPEGYLTGYHVPGLAPGDLPGVEPALASVGRTAEDAGLSVVMGTHLDTPDGLRNAAVVFSDAGAELGRYHKRALFGAWEKATFMPGDAPLRFDCGGLTVGLAICYDVEFPELIRAEARAGVHLVVVPTALMVPHDRVAHQMVPVRAMENQVFLGYANRCGSEAGLEFVGLSSIRGPDGQALAQAGTGTELLVAELDPAAMTATRDKSCYLDDADRLVIG